MITHRSHFLARTLVRGAAAGTLLVLVAGVTPAFADTPTEWPAPPHVPLFHFLVVLFLIPLGLSLVIGLLAALPSMIKGDSYTPGQPWVGDGEWFGGPRPGSEETGAESQTGSQTGSRTGSKTGDSSQDSGGAGATF